MIASFLKEIDESWTKSSEKKITLKILGSLALMLQCGYQRKTKDMDIFELDEVTPNIKSSLQEIAGKESKLCKKYRMYLDFVAKALPFLPPRPNFYPLVDLNKELKHFCFWALEVTDVVISKLSRFQSSDIDDIRAMIERRLVKHETLLERFKLAFDQWEMSSRREKLPLIIKNLNEIERDLFLVKETSIDLPSDLE